MINEEDGLFISSIPLPDGKWVAWFNEVNEAGNGNRDRAVKQPAKPKKKLVAMEFHSTGGLIEGPARVFNRGGIQIAKGYYKQGEKDGLWTIYASDGKEMRQKLTYKSGVRDGTWEEFWKGQLRSSVHFKDGLLEGEQITYFEDGKINMLAHYSKGEPNGEAYINYPDGKPKVKTAYDEGTEVGWYREWAPNGILTEESRYPDKAKDYFKPEKVNPSWVWSGIEGPSTRWHENGMLWNKSFYHNAERIYGDTTYDELGRISDIEKDSLATNKKTKIHVHYSYVPGTKIWTLETEWPDSLKTIRYFSFSGEESCNEIWKSFSVHMLIPGDTSTDDEDYSYKKLVKTDVWHKFNGVICQTEHFDPVGKNYTSTWKQSDGTPNGEDSVYAGKTRVRKLYDKKGLIREIRYYSDTTDFEQKSDDWVRDDVTTDNFPERLSEDSVQFFKKGKPLNGIHKIPLEYQIYSKGMLTNGRHTGHWTQFHEGYWENSWAHKHKRHQKKHISAETDFVNNQEQGKIISYRIYHPTFKMKDHKHPFPYTDRIWEVKNNRRDGQMLDFDVRGNVKSITTYHRDILHGKSTSYYEPGKIKDSCMFQNGQKEGTQRKWSFTGIKTEEVNFKAGQLHGTCAGWYDNGMKEYEGQSEMGEKTGEWTHYFKNGVANSRIRFLSVQETSDLEKKHRSDNKHTVIRNIGSNTDYFKANRKFESTLTQINEEGNAHVTYFYESGTKAQEGDLLYGNRLGTWTWWREDGSTEKEVDYTPGFYLTAPGDTLWYNGKYTSWHKGGKKAIEALIMSEEQKYDCTKEITDQIQNLFYLNGWDEQGQPVIVKGNGYFKGLDASNIVRSEGGVKDGLKDGFWKYRDSNGNLEEQGAYIKGLKEGKWLEGDLAGVHSIENACYREITAEELNRLLKELEVTETFYTNGNSWKMIKHNNKEKQYRPRHKHLFRKKEAFFSDFRAIPEDMGHSLIGDFLVPLYIHTGSFE